MKFVPDFLRRKKTQPDPTKPETLAEETPAPAAALETAAEDGAEKQGMIGRLRQKFSRSSQKAEAPVVADAPAAVELPKKKAATEDSPLAQKPKLLGALRKRLFGGKEDKAAEPAKETEVPKEEGLSRLEKVRNSLSGLVSKKKTGHKVNTVIIIAGAGIAVAGMAADMMFLGGAGTLAVLSMVYSDFRNAQHIQKISGEISKIDDKIDELKKANQPVPDFSPALTAVKSSIEDFQASAKNKNVPFEVAEDLENLRRQVETLQERIKPANDDASTRKNRPAPPAA